MLSVEGKGDQTLLLRRSIPCEYGNPPKSLRGPLCDSDSKGNKTDCWHFVDVVASDANPNSNNEDNSIKTADVIDFLTD